MSLVVADRWYEVRSISDGLSCILESHVAPWLRCNMWLVHGRNLDLLIDSGMGLKPLKAEVARLRERPVTGICTHCHFDHIGGWHEFETRLGHTSEADVFSNPDLHRTCADNWLGGDILTALPHGGYDIRDYAISPAPLTGYLNDGDVIDTGDRLFNVFHMPGHSPGSIALYEKATKTLFSGDIIYDGLLIDNAWHSDSSVYEESLQRLKELDVQVIHAGHEASFGKERLKELIESYLKGGQRLLDPQHFMAEHRQ
jgi:glyoxylase-like metal-dependent hydrolase (beta-lactamase superfamily II)